MLIRNENPLLKCKYYSSQRESLNLKVFLLYVVVSLNIVHYLSVLYVLAVQLIGLIFTHTTQIWKKSMNRVKVIFVLISRIYIKCEIVYTIQKDNCESTNRKIVLAVRTRFKVHFKIEILISQKCPNLLLDHFYRHLFFKTDIRKFIQRKIR